MLTRGGMCYTRAVLSLLMVHVRVDGRYLRMDQKLLLSGFFNGIVESFQPIKYGARGVQGYPKLMPPLSSQIYMALGGTDSHSQ